MLMPNSYGQSPCLANQILDPIDNQVKNDLISRLTKFADREFISPSMIVYIIINFHDIIILLLLWVSLQNRKELQLLCIVQYILLVTCTSYNYQTVRISITDGRENVFKVTKYVQITTYLYQLHIPYPVCSSFFYVLDEVGEGKKTPKKKRDPPQKNYGKRTDYFFPSQYARQQKTHTRGRFQAFQR